MYNVPSYVGSSIKRLALARRTNFLDPRLSQSVDFSIQTSKLEAYLTPPFTSSNLCIYFHP
jgi:hypothetical protein